MLDTSSPTNTVGSGIGNVVQGVADINQCISIILTTPKGSDPLRPDFACDVWQFLDLPLTIARPQMIREIVEAITHYEPRVNVLQVTVDLVPGTLSNLQVSITWQLAISVPGIPSGTTQTVSLSLALPSPPHF